ncbi:MAG: undecaprenyldiphospho-muramoylpentapeptide beta-N-acetylglucosaminyltransferase, partial [Anaerolineaceae bacterium]|nr:undecaprenyldiphospho-muramoylpentapeptide beta-N-acetylglucosaminyltransferase [Anaerolineaceae bacterium]
RLLICAGGTGGGVYPALAVLNALRGKVDPVLWVGSETGMESELIKRASLPYKAIPAAGVHGVGLRSLPGNLWQLSRGYMASRRILREFKPDVLFFTGGYVAAPMALSARGYASVVYVPDIEPGLALKTMARFASHIAISAEDSRRFLPRTVPSTVTGYPTRPELVNIDKTSARRQLRLDPKTPTLLVFGGSKGARSINNAIAKCLDQLLARFQVVHITGQLDREVVEQAKKSLPKELRARYQVHAYLHEEMGMALASADLVVCRAGASTLGELPLFGLPAILVPYPHAWQYQIVNAEYLSRHGAAVVIEDSKMEDELYQTIDSLFRDDRRLARMQSSMRSLARLDAADRIAHIILATAEMRKHD